MKKALSRSLVIVINLAITLAGAWILTGVIADLPYEMPDLMESSIRGTLKFTGSEQLANTDDIETLALLVTFTAMCLLVGVAVLFCNYLLGQCLKRQRNRHP